MKIRISEELLRKLPDFNVVACVLDVKMKGSEQLEETIHLLEELIRKNHTLESVLSIPKIKQARDAYKKLGKDPSRYRLAVESLYRRIVKNNDLYRINNVVDLGNILSIETMRSVCVADFDLIKGDVRIRVGTALDHYEGINRGVLNVENIPVYEDDDSPFGSTTSDTPRTAVHDKTTSVLIMVICFGEEDMEQDRKRLKELFAAYANTKNPMDIEVIRK